jgi:hypothetical protein
MVVTAAPVEPVELADCLGALACRALTVPVAPEVPAVKQVWAVLVGPDSWVRLGQPRVLVAAMVAQRVTVGTVVWVEMVV